jgi:hypothetical protein
MRGAPRQRAARTGGAVQGDRPKRSVTQSQPPLIVPALRVQENGTALQQHRTAPRRSALAAKARDFLRGKRAARIGVNLNGCPYVRQKQGMAEGLRRQSIAALGIVSKGGGGRQRKKPAARREQSRELGHSEGPSSLQQLHRCTSLQCNAAPSGWVQRCNPATTTKGWGPSSFSFGNLAPRRRYPALPGNVLAQDIPSGPALRKPPRPSRAVRCPLALF